MHGRAIPDTLQHELLLPHEVVGRLYASGLIHLLAGDADESCLWNDVLYLALHSSAEATLTQAMQTNLD